MVDGRIDLSLDEAAQALAYIQPDERDTWVAMAMALKAEFGEAAFAAWDEWSAAAGNYDAGAARSVWKSVKAGGGIGFGTLIAAARDRGWTPAQQELSKEDKARRKAEADARRKALDAAAEADEAKRAAWHARVATTCRQLVAEHLAPEGSSRYLDTKRVRSFGLLFVRQQLLVAVWLQDERIDVLATRDELDAFWKRHKAGELERDVVSFRHLKRGTIAVPMRDGDGALWNLQFITPTGGKTFLKHSRKSGLFHLLGDPGDNPAGIGIAEGYATAATIRMASGWPMVAAFDEGNLCPVAEIIHARWPGARLVICGDDDRETKGNPGRRSAEAAAAAVGGIALLPSFPAADVTRAQQEVPGGG